MRPRDGTAGNASDGGAGPKADPDGAESGEPRVEELMDDLESLARDAESTDLREEIRELEALLAAVGERGVIDSRVRHLRPSDAAEALIGSAVFAAPLLVEDGIFDIADHLFGVTRFGVPVFFVANALFVVVMTYALLEWTGRERTEARDRWGVIPARVVVVLAVSFAVAAVLMTVWGRVDGWRSPAEAVARISVLWTVGSLGGALGDLLSESDSGTAPGVDAERERRADGRSDDRVPAAVAARLSTPELVASLHEQFADLEAAARSDETRREVRRLRGRAQRATVSRRFGKQIRKYTGRDIAEAFVGSVFFSIPLLVEDGVFDVADYFLSFRVGEFPLFFALNAAFVLAMITALVYWAGPQDVRMSKPLFGVVPRRLVGISLVSFLTAAALMTMWGRVDGWRDPVVAVARVSAVWTVASFGAALGDILPGESSGDDIYDDLAELSERVDDGERSVGDR